MDTKLSRVGTLGTQQFAGVQFGACGSEPPETSCTIWEHENRASVFPVSRQPQTLSLDGPCDFTVCVGDENENQACFRL